MEMVPIGSGSGTVRRCGLVGVGMAFLDKVCHWQRTLRSQMLKPSQGVILFLLCVYPDVELSAPSVHHVCLPDATLPTLMTVNSTSEMEASPN